MARCLAAALAVALLAAGLGAKADDPKAGRGTGHDSTVVSAPGIDGEYTLLTAALGGQELPAEVRKAIPGLTVKDGVMTVKVNEETKTARLRLDPGKRPAEMDLMPEDGPEKGKTLKGIYVLEKGELKMAWAEGENAPRPRDFTSTDKVLVLTLKKK